MKKWNIYLLFILGLGTISCDENKLPDELFIKQVVIAKNGFQELDLEYNDQGKVTKNITVSISGTSVVGNDVHATVKECPDTLAGYNLDKYRKDSILYYEQLPDSCYTLANKGEVTINKGDEYTLLPIEFHLDKINKYKDYVLPLAITSVSDYEIGESQYSKVLLHINISNSFSFIYTPADTKVWNSDDGEDYNIITTNITLSALNNNTCRMYAGGVNTNDKNRENYLVEVILNPDSTLSYNALNKDIELEYNQNDQHFNVKEVPDYSVNSKFSVTTSLKMDYRYKYVSEIGTYHRHFKGTLNNVRVVYKK